MTSDGAGSGNGTRDDTTCGSGNARDIGTGTTMERTLVTLFIVLLIIVSMGEWCASESAFLVQRR